MDIKQGIEHHLKAAVLYKSQGLYLEARKAYDAAIQMVEPKDTITTFTPYLVHEAEEMLDTSQSSVRFFAGVGAVATQLSVL